MKKTALVLLLMAIVCAVVVTAVFAGSASVSGTLTPGGATVSQVAIISTPNCTGAYVAFAALYAAYPFTVDVDGLYTVTEPGTESAIYISSGSFDPAFPAANCIAASNTNPLNFSVALTAGTTYVVAVIEDTFAQDGMSYNITISGPGNVTFGSADCPYPLPTGSTIYNVPAGAPAFYEPDLGAQTNFNLPAGTWYISEFTGDFAKVWISCEGSPVYIPANAVAR
jgi:hypothetical protein